MARIRTIKPDFFKNEEMCELPAMIRLLFIGLWTLSDREGRLADRPKRIKIEIFPYDNVDVDKSLDLLQASGFLIRYKVNVNGEASVFTPEQLKPTPFIQIVNFLKHQIPHYKESPSEIPSFSDEYKGPVVVKALTNSEREFIFERDGRVCKKCKSTDDLTIDHIMPISLGGSKEPDNLQVLCRSCNSGKNNRVNLDPTLDEPSLQEGKGSDNGNGKEVSYVRDLIFENEMLVFFGFNEIANPDKQLLIFQFCSSLFKAKILENFKIQFKNYCELKKITGYKHNFYKFLGNQSDLFIDGVWNAENWEQKLKEEKEKNCAKKENNKGVSAVLAAFAQNKMNEPI